jgi:hypothetical protein
MYHALEIVMEQQPYSLMAVKVHTNINGMTQPTKQLKQQRTFALALTPSR